MGLVGSNATFVRKARRSLHHLLALALAVSTLSAISIAVAPPATSAGAGLSLYIKNESGRTQDFTRNEFTTGTCHTLTTSTIDYQWGVGSPGGSCNVDGFTVYATGQILAPVTGTVNFCAIADDGFYLSINSAVVIDNWIDQGANSNCNSTGTYSMVAGQIYSIKTWMHENGGGATMQLLWSYTGQSSYIAVPASNLGTFCSPSSTSSGGYTILTFTSTTTCAWNVPAGVTAVDALVVGGGGAGGGGIGGGGGAGEFVETTRTGLTSGTQISISVGAGGTSNNNWNAGNAGGQSRFDSVIAYGGGGGGTNSSNPPVASGGPNFGSQGGGGYETGALTVSSRSDGITGYRNNGGSGSLGASGSATGGGGGGAGGAGGAGTTSSGSPAQSGGAGGAGRSSSITGTATFYAGGGGGGINGAAETPNGSTGASSGNPGTGGSGIGGSGGAKANAAVTGQYGNRGNGTGGTVNSNGSAGAANTGSGGGGASNWVSGGAGGSGVVIIRYLNAPAITLSTSTISATVGEAVTSYSISNSGGAAASYAISPSLAVSGLSFSTSTGLISGTPSATASSATYTITATNSTSTATATFSISSNAGTPSAPTITGITAGNTTLSVAFTAPSSNGGATISNYEYSTDGGANWRSRDDWPSTASPLVINTLVNGTTYNVQIRAVNSVGNGPATASTSGTPNGCNPSSSTSGGFTVLTFTNTTACQWSVPAGVTSAEVLIVAGGGGGNRGVCSVNYGAGGGGGGVSLGTRSLTPGDLIAVTVGAGGSAALINCGGTRLSDNAAGFTPDSGTDGGASSFGAFSASGGLAPLRTSLTGGSSGNGLAGGTIGSSGSSCGSHVNNCGAGGGGGAQNAGSGLNGGAGVTSSISGTSKIYGGGGPGRNNTVNGTSGDGLYVAGSTPTANTGGGGSDITAGAAGVVIVRYINAPSISLSTSTISATVGTAVTSYSISNSGGAAASYAISPSLADSGLNGLTFSTSTGLISGSPSAVATSATFSITATNSSGTSTASFSITTTAGSALTPTFGSTTATATGFTVQISNYSASYTWGGSATASGSVEISDTGLVTVTGVAPGTASTATITTTRTGYTGGSATVSATSITGSALTPTFGSTTATADGFTVQISNYSASYTWGGTATASGSVAISETGLVTVTGVALGTSSTATITTTRTGYTGGSATVSATSITGSALTPAFGSTTATADGFTVQISNYSASYTWGGSATASGSVSINGSGLVTVTGVAPGTSSTATITTTRTGYTGGSATVSETSIIGAALTPTFGIATSTSTGFTVQISNYSTSYTWGGTATASGSVSINGSGLVTVTGVAPGTSSTATITTTRTGYTGGSATVSATSITGSALTPTFGSTTATADGFTVQISNYSASYTWGGTATASGSVSINGTGLVTVTGVALATSSTVTITTTRTGYNGGSATVTATSLSSCSVSSTTANGYTTLRITSVGSCVWTTPSGVTLADVLVVGGGGGGGSANDNGASGGGGAGYVYALTDQSISGNITVSVGAGGAGGVGATGQTFQNGSAGGRSQFGSFTALGGGGGFGSYESFAGACPTYTTPVKGGTAATQSQAATGGQDGCNTRNGFGGGGQSSTTNQTGGAGLANSITGTSVTYGTGGTGGTDNADVTPTAQASNTGNGGTGAASRASFGRTGGAGGSGVVIIRYLNAPAITLSTSTISATVGNAITSYTISNSGGSAASYSISPALSTAGLSFNTSTGLISGTPSATLTSTSYTITATNSSGTSTATFSLTVSISCAAGGVCVVGDTGPGGGIVFYVAPSGGTFACGQSRTSTCKYLEAASITAGNFYAINSNEYFWSDNLNTAIGTTLSDIGAGYSNTLKMVRQSGAGTAGAGSAARNWRGGGLNDWYLPSRLELYQLYLNRSITGTTLGFMSSTEVNATNYYYENGTGSAGESKGQKRFIRPIRAFGSSAVESAIIYVPEIAGVTAPVSGATPVTTVTAANGYTGTVTWSSSPSTFAAATTYTATITLTAASGFTLTGVTANFFTVTGATSVTHLANSGSITAVFPATAAAAQTITRTSTSPGSPVLAGTYTPTATASSGLTVAITIASGSSSICSIASGVVTFNAAGSCVIQYNQAGNASYAAATQVTETLTIGQGSQSITFGSLSNRTLGSGTYSISASSSSSLSVAFTSATTSVCTVATTTITLVTAGTCTINANQAGNTNYLAATQVQQSFTIAPALLITTPSGASLQGTYNTAFTSLTISSSGGAGTNSFSATGSLPTGVSLSSAGVLSGTPSIAGDFSLTVTVTDANGATATTSSFTISIAKGVSSISISAPAYTFTGSPQGPDSVTTSGSAGAVTYAYAGRGSTTYASSSTKPTNVGTYTVTATLAADSNFASVSATADFAITAGSALTPAFGSTTATADGFTVQISNYSSDYTWGGSATASGSVAISDTGLVTVTGVASGTSSTATITTTRTSYTGGSATVSATSISSNVATLSALTLTTATLSPTFASGTTTYTASVANATTSITVTPTRTQANATITVNGTAVTSGSASGSISLNVGSNIITVVVTAQDGTTTATYTVTVTRAEATYTITLAAGTSGTGSNQTLTKTNGTSLTLPDSASANGYFTRAGYTVSGWSTSNGGSQTHALGGSFTTDAATTLYPVWTTVSCSPTSSTAFGYTIYKFTTTGTCFWTVPDGITNVDVLVVAGGGGGGYSWGNTGAGGGGGGQVKTGTATLSSPLEVTVGAGGSAGTLSSGRGGSGGNSSTAAITALGGTGGCGLAAPTCSVASMATASAAANGGAGAASPGNGTRGKGGGGSSTTVSISGSETGGVGTGSDYSGTSVNYGVGGNGGSPTGSSPNSVGSSGSVNTGNGGGGASTNSASNGNSALGANGGAGGSGVVIIRKANTLTVTYNANGGTTPSGGSATTVTGGTVSSLATTSRSGYTFTGWFTQASGGTQITTSAAHNFYGSFPLYARWTANTLTITYDSQNGSAISNGSTTTGGSISASPGTPTRAGYTFGGWSTTDTGTAVTFPHTHGQTANFTLFAVWNANSLTVTYDSQGGSAVTAGGSQTGASISAAPTAPTRTGYTFAGWSTTTTGSVVTFPFAHGQTANFTLYAIWSANSLTVTYDSQGGSAVTSGGSQTGASISAAPTAPARAGYTFGGWSVTDGGTAVTFPYAHGQTADFTLFAKWSANALTITYNSQGGSAVTSGSVNTAASISSAPTAPTRAGYTFGGWSATDTGTAVTFPYAHGQTADFTLFGKWSANALTITYNSQGGSAVSSGSVNTAASISAAPTAPTRAGYAFAGWSATDTGTAVTFPHAHGQTADFTLFAKWSANALTITYDSKSGSAVSSGTVNTGASISVAPTAPTRTGYTFAGWSATDTGTAVTFPHAHGQTANFTLFAKWTGNTNTITYDSKGGAAVADGSFVTGGSIVAAPTEPIRAGYTLVGWSLTDGGSVISYPYSPPGTSGITLYAIWTGIACSPTSTTTGGYTIYTFATAGTCFWSVPVGVTDVEILAVAGGGGGGYAWDNAGAGGGAGGQVKTGAATLGSILEVTVGAGGTAGTVSSTRGGSGGNSSALTVIALGGTGGCAARAITCSNSAQATSLAAANGGVGGIGGASGKGGGGSNTAGTLTTTTAGGAGTASNYSGTSATYGVGGTGGTARGLATSTNIVGAAGSANTGNGGGGASAKSSSGEVNGGTGGTGLVVVRIASALTITYDSQSGSAVSNGSTFTGASIATAPTEPTRSNYTFLGWFTATTGGSAISFPYVHGQTANFTLYAKWTLNTYSIVFNANSGLGLMGNQTITHGVATNLNANLYSRANYVFYRWATAADGTGTTYNNLAEITLTAGTTLYAQWTANTYVVTFNYNGGNGGDSTATASFTTAGSPIMLPVPTKTGFTFAGWHSDAALATQIGTGVGNRSYSPTGGALSLNAYAKWEAVNYTFTYNSNSADSGSVPTESSKQITQTATVKANTGNLVRVGYTFSGWNIASDGTGTNYLSGSLFTVGSDDVILFAKWSPNTYTVTYNINGGTGNAQRSSANVTSDTYTTDSSPVVFPGVGTLTRSGYTFGGWNTSAAGTGTNYVATNTYTTVSNVIFYAKWNPVTYTITYNGNQNTGGTTPTAGGYTTGQDSPYAVLSNSFTKTLNVFGGWNTADNGTGTSYSPGASITTLVDIVLYAVWIPQFTLHYAINGGSVTSGSLPGDQLYNTGTSVGPLFSAVSRTGYTFDGWVNGSTTIVPNGNFTILADSVLTAKWTPINYTISYNSDGGSEAPGSTTRQIGQSFTVDGAVSKPGYNFAGWATGSTVVGPDAVVVMGSANIAYTAQWVAKVYTVSYDWNGGRGTAVEDVNYTFGTTAITLPLVGDRIKDGFTFAGWSETSTGSLLSATYIPSRTRTLIARWTVGNFTITYNLSGGTLANASVAVQNGSPTVLPLPTRTNFVFDGWHSATTGGSRLGVNGDSFTPIASQTVYARWIQSSLYGISNSLTRIGSVVTVANIANTFSGANSNSSVSVSVPENALPAGTTINFDLVGNSSRATGLLPNVSYLISIAISWITADGLVPDTVPGKPISVTISNETIKIGATAYAIVNNASTLLGTATQDRTITIALTSDPEVVIAAVKPSAPLNVTATSNGHQQSVISWSAPSTNGGSDINGYTVTSNTSATCTTTTTSCTISGLAHGTAYTFTVTATNNVGTSDASTSASATTAALYTVAFNAKGGTPVANGSFLTASTISEPTAPTRAGYSFAGWSATDGGSAIGFPYAPGVTSNITLFARWDALDNAVTFDSRGGSPVSSSVFSSGGTVAEPTAPTRAGFTFAGWAATDTGTAVTFPHAPGVVTDITLYAKWTEIVQNNSGGSSAPAPVTPSVPAPVVPVKSNVTVVAPITVTGDKDAKVNAVEIAVLPSGSTAKPPTIKIDKASEKFIAEFKVVDGKLVLTPETGFSGKRTVTVTITENSIERIVQIPLIVLPEVVTKPIFTPTAWNRTTVSWTESPNADSVTVYLNGKKVCATSASSCSVSQVLGPRAVIEIVSNGGDRTVSKEVEADFRQNNPVAITRLVSSTIRQAILTTVDTKALDKVIALIKTQGFGTIQISEISPTKKTAPLAAARINAIKKYINDKTGSRKITFEVVPAGSRTLLTSIFVKA